MNDEVRVSIDVTPAAETDIFRIGAADDILRILVDAHDEEFTIPELVDITGVSRSTVWRGVDLLDELGILELRTTPQRNYVSIDPDVLQKDDPILAIAQSEFHAPVRAFLELVEAEVPAVVGVVLFGSVARGEADRVSDIDLFIVVDGDRTAARRTVGSIVQDLEARRFDGDRYAFEPFVESVESAKRIGGRLREQLEGITLVNSAELQTIRQVVYANGEAD